MNKISPQSKSFIVLFCLALVGAYTCLSLWNDLAGQEGGSAYSISQQTVAVPAEKTQSILPPPAVINTQGWKTYTDKSARLVFKYPPEWKVLAPVSKGGYTVLQIDPGKKYYDIKIYISAKDYYIMSGLPAQTDTLGGQTALNVSNLLYGVQANGLYYTFDIGLSLSLKDQFNALVHSVNFNA